MESAALAQIHALELRGYTAGEILPISDTFLADVRTTTHEYLAKKMQEGAVKAEQETPKKKPKRTVRRRKAVAVGQLEEETWKKLSGWNGQVHVSSRGRFLSYLRYKNGHILSRTPSGTETIVGRTHHYNIEDTVQQYFPELRAEYAWKPKAGVAAKA